LFITPYSLLIIFAVVGIFALLLNFVLVFPQSLSDTKTTLGPDEVKKAAWNLILVGDAGQCVNGHNILLFVGIT
jgi:hypothetical protein